MAVLAGSLFSGSIASTPYAGYRPSTSKVVFLEHNLLANGTVINGSVPFRSINFPSYWFNDNIKQLNGEIDFQLNDSLLMIYGDGLTLRGNFGAGTGNKLYGVYSLPVQADKANIYSIDGSGNVGMYVNNRSVYLRPGQEYTYQEKERLKEGNGTVNVLYEHRYINHGLIDKNAIQTRMVV